MVAERPSRARLVVRPLALFLVVSALVFGLAKLHLAKPGVPKIAAGTSVALGDPYRGETIFGQSCAGCHGIGGKGGSVGPRLIGDHIALARVKAQIDQGGGAMPAALVSGLKERDVLAFVATLIAAPG
jgi:mono/diheme cytochrome c family protein